MSPSQIAEANALTKAGERPFHLKLSFQIYELNGKPGEKGTLDQWWAGPEGSHLEISAPSFGTVGSTNPDAPATPAVKRSLFLIAELLKDVEDPGSLLGISRHQIETEERVLGTMVLECMHAVSRPDLTSRSPTQVCADHTSGNIRLVESPGQRIARNHPGAFSGTQVDVDTSVTFGGIQAISGHIDELQTFDTANASVKLTKPVVDNASRTPPQDSLRLASGVIAGKKIGGYSPVYPPVARQNHIQGTVMLEAVISKDGKVENLFPLASPDPLLTAAAIDAVKSWTYSPYLLNGIPTEVTSTVTVNFNLR